MVLICTFLMTSDVEYIFIHLLVICMSSLGEKMPIQVLCPFCKLNTLLLGCFRSLHTFDINSLSDLWFANIFPNTSCLFHYDDSFLAVQKHFDIVCLYIFVFDFWAFGATFKNHCQCQGYFMFSFLVFTV